MTSTAHEARRHPVAESVARLHVELDAIVESPLWTLSGSDAGELLGQASRLRSRIAELELRIAAHADRVDVGARDGATSTASWWAHRSRLTRVEAHRRVRLARRLLDHEDVADALAAGDIGTEQAQVIVDAVDALPTDLVDLEIVTDARRRLLVEARAHDAKALRVLGRRILDVVAPGVGEEHERRVLEREERDARAACRLTMADDGLGRAHGRFTLPAVQGAMLRKALMALASPRRTGADTRPWAERLGSAFAEYVEAYPADRLPDAGGIPASLVVTVPLATQQTGLGSAPLDTGAVISASEARRLACRAGIVPAVLGGNGQVLDLGRTRRFHSKAQRVAMAARDGGCTAEGCDWPARPLPRPPRPGVVPRRRDDAVRRPAPLPQAPRASP